MALYNPSAGQTDWRKTLQQSMQQPGAISQGGQVAGLGGSYGQQPQARSATVTQPQGSGTPYNAAASPSATFNNPDNNNWGMTPDPNQTAPQYMPNPNGGGGSFVGGGSVGGGGWASGFQPGNGQFATLGQDQYNEYKQQYATPWASNSIVAPESVGAFGQDAFAWNVAYQQRATEMGYPPGSFGMTTHSGNLWWVSPDGMGPNGEPGAYASFGSTGSIDPRTGIDWSINQEAGMHDWEMSPEQFLQYHGDWVAAYASDPQALQRALNDPQDPIWQHVDPGDLQAAIDLYNNGGVAGPGTNGPGNNGKDPSQGPPMVDDGNGNGYGNGNGHRNRHRGRRGGQNHRNRNGNGGNRGASGGGGYGPGRNYGPGGGRPNGGGRGGNGGGGGNNNRNNNNNKGGNNKGGGKNNNKKK